MTEADDILGRIAIETASLREYGAGDDLASRVHALLLQQRKTWDLARTGYAALDKIRVREFEYDGFVLRLQFNPGRIVSSSAKVDPQSIKERKCFLCPAHLPVEQRGIPYGRYLVLCNPFPIFPEHFTLTNVEHLPQQIATSFADLLAFARLLAPRYTVFYNGPRCGASAPDHLHFQAGSRGFMPIDEEYASMRDSKGTLVRETETLRIYRIANGLRPFIALESGSDETLVREFEKVYSALSGGTSASEEPMMNIIASYVNEAWQVLIFPRRKHRPSFYFEDGPGKILISPAAVDLGGVCITPREEDFNKVTREDVERMFREVMRGNEELAELDL